MQGCVLRCLEWVSQPTWHMCEIFRSGGVGLANSLETAIETRLASLPNLEWPQHVNTVPSEYHQYRRIRILQVRRSHWHHVVLSVIVDP